MLKCVCSIVDFSSPFLYLRGIPPTVPFPSFTQSGFDCLLPLLCL